MTDSHRPRRRVLASIVASLIGLAAALLLAEGLVRLFFDEAVQPRFVIDSGYGVRSNQVNVRTRHYVPGEYDVAITTNSTGMRGQREYALERVPGSRRVLMLGDSFTFGYGVEDDEVVSAVLETLLNSDSPAGGNGEIAGGGAEVINFGVAGFGQAEELVTWQARASAWRPDDVVLFYFENDIGNNVVSQLFELGPDGSLKRTGRDFLPGTNLQDSMFAIPPVRWLFEHSEAWNLIRHRLSSLVQTRLMKEQGLVAYDDSSAPGVNLTRTLLRQLAAEITAAGARVYFVAIPNKRGMHSGFPLTPEEVTAMGARMLDGRQYLTPADYYVRDNHWRPVGHRKTAERLAAMLAESNAPANPPR